VIRRDQTSCETALNEVEKHHCYEH